jgi:cellobiose phosphorylase
LGIRPEFDGLRIDPCLPGDLGELEITRRYRGADIHITIKNPVHVEKGIRSMAIDGQPADGNRICPDGTKTEYQVTVIMG